MEFNPGTYGKKEINTLVGWCLTQIEKWQVRRYLNDALNTIEQPKEAYVFSKRFEFLQLLRACLQNQINETPNTMLNCRANVEEIDTWSREEMNKFVAATPAPIGGTVEKISSPSAEKNDSLEWFLEERAKSILDKLVAYYGRQQPKKMALMVFALKEIGLLKPGFDANLSALNLMLKKSFSSGGTDTGFRKQYAIYRNAGPDQLDEIKVHVDKIKAFLSPL
jgi:hypothetical protein